MRGQTDAMTVGFQDLSEGDEGLDIATGADDLDDNVEFEGTAAFLVFGQADGGLAIFPNGLWLVLEVFDDFSYPGFMLADFDVQATIV